MLDIGNVAIRPHFDSNGKDYAIERIQDCTDILEWNAQARTQEQHSDWGRHRARIPCVVLIQWMDEEHRRGNTRLRMFSPEYNALVERKLQDPEWAYLRVDKPKLQVGFR